MYIYNYIHFWRAASNVKITPANNYDMYLLHSLVRGFDFVMPRRLSHLVLISNRPVNLAVFYLRHIYWCAIIEILCILVHFLDEQWR